MAISTSVSNSARYCNLAAVVIALTALTHGGAAAQPPVDIKLRVTHVNDFRAGYNPVKHTYDEDAIRNVLGAQASRPIEATTCDSFPTRKIRREHHEDGKKCSSVQVTLPPTGAAAFVWTLRGRHKFLNKIVDLQQTRQVLDRLSAPLGDPCTPLERPRIVSPSQCRARFSPSTSSGPSPATHNEPPSYTVRFDILDGNDKVILSRSQSGISVPRQVPLIVSVGESLAAGQANPDKPGKSKSDEFDPGDILNSSGQDCRDDTTDMIRNGNKPVMQTQPVWMEPRDYRSLRSGPASAARQLLKDWPYIVFLSFAKSGSVISSTEEDNDILEQLEHVRRVVGTQRIDALLLSAGGNDVGFSDVLTTMAGDFRGSDAQQVMNKFLRQLLQLRNEGYPKINAKIKELDLNVGSVIINEYPGGLFNDKNGEPQPGCGVFDTLAFWKVSKRDAVSIRDMGALLNDDVKLAANAHGWRLVTGLSEAFARRGYCSGQSFYRFAEDSCDMQGDFEGIMHPNEQGTAEYARALARELRRVLPKPLGQPPLAPPG